MRNVEIITSSKNPKVRALQGLRKRRLRREAGLVLVEGAREAYRAIASGWVLKELYFCEQLLSSDACKILAVRGDWACFSLAPTLYERLAIRESSDGLICVFHEKVWDRELLLNQKGSDPYFFIVADGIEKPGNLGAILRTADGCGADAVFATSAGVDFLNPNTVRASLGTVFSVATFQSEAQDLIGWLKVQDCLIVVAALDSESIPYIQGDYTGSVALVLGSEAQGVSSLWRASADKVVSIPMHGIADSLNVSVAAGILSYEVLRQRS